MIFIFLPSFPPVCVRHKLFMRCSVLILDALIFLPSVLAVVKAVYPGTASIDPRATISMAVMAMYPGLIIIDNGHFQYNNASLGEFILFVNYSNLCYLSGL